MKLHRLVAISALGLVLSLATLARATETENLGIAIVPAPAAVKIDGQINDWDLSGSIFACGDVETQRDKFAMWFSAMYDKENVYLLARWKDYTPMNNPGSTTGDMGFQGDCLQFRFIANPGTPNERASHWTCWKGTDGRDVMDAHFGLFGGTRSTYVHDVKDAKAQGAQQAMVADGDGKGYVQEISIPWKLLADGGPVPAAGGTIVITLEPNFTIGTTGRMSIKDIFRAGIQLDKVFTFQSFSNWGVGTLEAKGQVTPRVVRLADNREFAVRMDNGQPVVDWTGVIKSRELPGFKTIAFAMPEDGYVSLNIKDKEGQVVRQLLNCAFYTKGNHEVKWDGLGTPSFRTPAQPVAAGAYTSQAIYHTGIGLRLRGFACNGGSAPWDATPQSNWGGDHGVPVTAATDGQKVYLGWSGAEAGKAILACDLKGNVQWHNTRGGIGGAQLVAVDKGIVYVQNGKSVYRLDSKQGGYSAWAGTDSPDLAYKPLYDGAPDAEASGMVAGGGKVYIAFAKADTLIIVDGSTGKLVKKVQLTAPSQLAFTADGKLLAISQGTAVVSVDAESAQAKPLISGLSDARGLAIDKAGQIYVAVRGEDNQVKVFSPDGKPVAEIGRKGGRPALGAWIADGMLNVAGIVVDSQNQLWVTEETETPKRVAVWDTTTGKLLKEFFGPTHYGASGGAILPADPNIMVGEGCEWKLDPTTGRGICTGVYEHELAGFARFATGSNGKTYLVTAGGRGSAHISIQERIGEGVYKLRATINNGPQPKTKEDKAAMTFWADANDDQRVQPGEQSTIDGFVQLTGYIGITHYVNTDLTLYGSNSAGGPMRVKVASFTACNAPKYDVQNAQSVPAWGLASPDNRYVLEWGSIGKAEYFRCFDIGTKQLRWTYPNTFSGVHGSHYAPGPETGLLRGVLGIVGTAKLPDPIGFIWGLNSNVGEWYLFTQDGFFVTTLFQSDPMKVQWPEKAVPGAILDNCPPGLGGEDFGGSLQQGTDGKVYVQAGKTGLWNVEVTGLDTIKPISGGTAITVSDADLKEAQGFYDRQLQAAIGTRSLTIKKATVKFTGNPSADFPKGDPARYQKSEDNAAITFAAWDDQNLYLAWDVKDNTPWTNGATEAAQLYLSGDTVDFQLGTDPAAKKDRAEPVLGDLRLSIGNFKGKPTAVLYRKVASDKSHAMTFSSGVVKEYVMDSVVVLPDPQITVKPGKSGYVVEAAVTLSDLGLKPADGLTLRGDFGVTFGDLNGQRTRIRSYWNNQQTGIVDDAVFELKLEPKNWGELMFK